MRPREPIDTNGATNPFVEASQAYMRGERKSQVSKQQLERLERALSYDGEIKKRSTDK